MITHRDIHDVCYLKSKLNRYQNEKDIFWPFYLWRVAAPKSKPSLNIFQMLVLKLILAGCHDNEKLCRYSNLDKELIRHILAQLTNDGYLDGWSHTDKANDLLVGVEESANENTSYYILQDATTGKLMPRLLSTLPHIEGMDFRDRFPQFVRSKGSGKLVKPLLINNTVKPEAPTAEQMNTCLRAYRRVLNQLKQADFYISDDALEVNYSIEFIEPEPIAAFIHTKLFSTISGERSWYLSDPTGLTETFNELNSVAEQLLDSNKHFASRVNEVMGIAEDEYTLNYKQQEQLFEEQAKVELLSSYPWVQKHPLIEKHVLASLRFRNQVEQSQNPRQEVLEGLLNELQKIIEAWLKNFMKPNEANNDWEVLVMRWNGNRPVFQHDKRLIEQIYLGVTGVSVYAAKRLATVRGGNVQSAMTRGNQSLKPMLAAMLLTFPKVVEQLSTQLPHWLDKAIRLADDRNQKASHASGEVLTEEEVKSHFFSVDELLKVLERILGSK
ncbi:hypothetical protein [Vibrio splendidus]|uniref:hypothetical protein n=1 Tax=Vibrio splendidus TaxID=29497 RepID=UPI00148B7035|nr:hypothetical protein [Vibrio splendidus]NOJ08746.1 hypothetical protein [Vibrio splendidus]